VVAPLNVGILFGTLGGTRAHHVSSLWRSITCSHLLPSIRIMTFASKWANDDR
jgi:hypothetical protein